MASPPSTGSSSISTAKKRPSISTSMSAVAPKKPRLSHPLRQTSFPASIGDAGSGYYASVGPLSARSETGSVISTTSTATAPKPRGRGRPRKSATIHTDDGHLDNISSPIDGHGRGGGGARSKLGGARSVISVNNNQNDGTGAGGAAGDAVGEEDEDDVADMARFQSTHDADKEADEQQIVRLDKLKSVLDADQMSRLEKWRAIAFPKRTVQKLVNQIVSQSVTEGPINAVRVYAKWYAAEIVERAREIQDEWAQAYDFTRTVERDERAERVAQIQERLSQEDQKSETSRISEYDRRKLVAQLERAKKLAEEYIPNPHRGGLLPDHLREALRRYKADGEGGGVGFEGLSHPLLGTHGSRAWSQADGATGRRLFR